jgi:hypothetical protein
MNLIAIEMSCWGGHFQFCVAHYNGTLFGLLGFWKFKSISEIVTQEHFFFNLQQSRVMCRPIHYYVQTNGVVGFGGLSLFF